ncbi:hypothetical protein D3C84_531310 [compost metagenome]
MAEVFAAFALIEAAGVVVVLQIRDAFAPGLGLHQQFGLFEVVVAAGHPAAAGFHAHAEAFDRRRVRDQAAVLLVGGGRELGEGRLVVAEDQNMPVRAVLEVVVNTFFLAQALEEVQVAFVVLHAELALGVARAELKLVGVGLDAVLFEHLADDLRNRKVLEDPLVAAQGQVGQLRAQSYMVATQALAGFALGDAVDQAVDAVAGG